MSELYSDVKPSAPPAPSAPSEPSAPFDYEGSNVCPPPPNPSSIYDPLQQALLTIAAKFFIAKQYISKLRKLIGWEIVIICDDSGSMASASDAFPTSDPFAQKLSRFDELKRIVEQIMDIACVMDSDGTDVYFLNRPDAKNVTSHDQIAHLFAAPPGGSTPIVKAFNRVIADKMSILNEKKLLVIIITDGVPDEGIAAFTNAIASKPKDVHVSIAACTDDDNVMNYLNKMDVGIPFVDICDDYLSEQKQILSVQGKNFPFSFGDWVVKILLGTIDLYFDALDEKRVNIESGEVEKSSSLTTRTPVSIASGGCWCF
jgi:hypothetical protein